MIMTDHHRLAPYCIFCDRNRKKYYLLVVTWSRFTIRPFIYLQYYLGPRLIAVSSHCLVVHNFTLLVLAYYHKKSHTHHSHLLQGHLTKVNVVCVVFTMK
ncbi:hypothetical protein BGW80DRAFT_197579 [Lactifluus volemus]|nr:hypothetical protein BGW80DRAFT_197579 [Lactifluus volemus]